MVRYITQKQKYIHDISKLLFLPQNNRINIHIDTERITL